MIFALFFDLRQQKELFAHTAVKNHCEFKISP